MQQEADTKDANSTVAERMNFGFPVSDGIGRLQIIKNSDLEELRELGSGTYGTVYHGKWRGTDVAIKRINAIDRCFSGKPSEQERMRYDFWNEAINLADLHHPNVVAFYDVVLDGPGGSVATVTEYMVNGSLRNALQKSERDTLQVRLGPKLANAEEIPEVCRNEVLEWNQQVERLGSILLGLLSEGLGMSPGKLQELTCLDTRMMVGHYYPYCPQPDLTIGLTSHADPRVITVLLQDQVGGLQVKHGDEWVDVTPVPGALVVNIGDILQIMSNDEYKSIDHRVLANPSQEPRVSIAVFCNPSNCENEFGLFPELVSLDKSAAFRQFTLNEYMRRFFTKELDGKSLINYFRA